MTKEQEIEIRTIYLARQTIRRDAMSRAELVLKETDVMAKLYPEKATELLSIACETGKALLAIVDEVAPLPEWYYVRQSPDHGA